MDRNYDPTRILTHKGKHGDATYFARDRREEQLACKEVFDLYENHTCYYQDEMNGDMALLYLKAKTGDLEAIRQFIHWRSDAGYEYEGVSIDHIQVPREKDAEDKSKS